MESTGLLIDQLYDRINKLEAENARLREAQSVLATEVLAWRACPPDHFNKVWSQPSMSGKHRSEFRQAIIDAMEATDRHGLTPPQPVAGFKWGCSVEKCENGLWDVISPCRKFWLNVDEWFPYKDTELPAGKFGVVRTEALAMKHLAACPTPPPGVSK